MDPEPLLPVDPPAIDPADPWGDQDAEVAWEPAFTILREAPTLGALVRAVGPVRLPPPEADPFRALARGIVFQQLAGKAAATIWGRVEVALSGAVSPAAVLAAPEAELRAAGLSRAKLAALRDLARLTSPGDAGDSGEAAAGEPRPPALDLAALPGMDDAAVIRALVQVRGIGPWTARMHLIFQLQRPDIWPVLDLAVRVGWARIHRLPEPPDPRTLEPLADPFRPWRSAVAWYCWRVVDTAMELPA